MLVKPAPLNVHTFLVSVITPGYILTSINSELEYTNKR